MSTTSYQLKVATERSMKTIEIMTCTKIKISFPKSWGESCVGPSLIVMMQIRNLDLKEKKVCEPHKTHVLCRGDAKNLGDT